MDFVFWLVKWLCECKQQLGFIQNVCISERFHVRFFWKFIWLNTIC